MSEKITEQPSRYDHLEKNDGAGAINCYESGG